VYEQSGGGVVVDVGATAVSRGRWENARRRNRKRARSYNIYTAVERNKLNAPYDDTTRVRIVYAPRGDDNASDVPKKVHMTCARYIIIIHTLY